jgi:hypothetical protein
MSLWVRIGLRVFYSVRYLFRAVWKLTTILSYTDQ